MLLFALLLVAQAVPPRMPVDAEPSAFACTFDVALSGARCIYEAAPGPKGASDNSKAAADAGVAACAAAARRDEALRKDCEKSVADASLGACALSSRLADAQGRLTPQARGCVEAVREVIARTSRAAALSLGCCKCLGESRCAVPASQCKSELADLMPGAALTSCLSKSCPDACSFAAPLPAKSSASPPAENPADKI
jgi:hypothetical protein